MLCTMPPASLRHVRSSIEAVSNASMSCVREASRCNSSARPVLCCNVAQAAASSYPPNVSIHPENQQAIKHEDHFELSLYGGSHTKHGETVATHAEQYKSQLILHPLGHEGCTVSRGGNLE